MTEQKDVFATFPWDGKLLAHFNGHFESIFIALQPFCYIPFEYQYILDRINYDASQQDFLNYSKPIRWEEIQGKIGIDDITRIERAIQARRLYDEYRDITVEQLLKHLEQQRIFAPEIDEFDPNFQDMMLKTLKYLGYDFVWISDEFDIKERIYMNIDELIKSDIMLGTSNIFTPDHKILMGAIYGMSSLYICASQEMIEKMKQFYPLEGFYADEKTEVEWTFSLRNFYFFDDNNQALEVDLTPQVFFEKILKIKQS